MTQELKTAAVQLSAEYVAELETIKAHHGLHNTSDALRMLIRKEARRIDTRRSISMTVPEEEK